MREKLVYTTTFFFTPVLQKLATVNPLLGIKLDFQFFIICLSLLPLIQLIAIVYFFLALINWINTGFQLNKLPSVVISAIAILGLNYSIKSIKSNWVKRTQKRIQSIPNALSR